MLAGLFIRDSFKHDYSMFWQQDSSKIEYESMIGLCSCFDLPARMSARSLSWHPYFSDHHEKLTFIVLVSLSIENNVNRQLAFNRGKFDYKNWPLKTSTKYWVPYTDAPPQLAPFNIGKNKPQPYSFEYTHSHVLTHMRNHLSHKDRAYTSDTVLIEAIYDLSESYFVDLYKTVSDMSLLNSKSFDHYVDREDLHK